MEGIKKKLKKGMALWLLLGACFGYAQQSTIDDNPGALPTLTSPPPDVYAFQKYGDVPVSYSTGVPQISVPLYTIQTQAGVNIPLTLSYHSGGIRVDEVSGLVGLGWNLVAEGLISSRINGKPDLFNSIQELPASAASYLDPAGSTMSPVTHNGNPLYTYLLGIFKGEHDGQPDTYTYSLPGISGEFFIDGNNAAHPIPAGNVKVEWSNFSPNITDGKGNKFEFGRGSSTSRTGLGCSATILQEINSTNTSFNLRKITTYRDEVVTYNYRTINYNYPSAVVQTAYRLIQSSTTGCPSMPAENCDNVVASSQQLLTSIQYPGGSVEFKYSDESNYGINGSTTREDLPGGVALRKVIQKDMNGNEISSYILNYDYFHSPGGSSSENYRLKLTEVIKDGQEEHSFDYYEDTDLPARLTYAQDYWGFYNGNDNNTSLIPDIDYNGQLISSGKREVGDLQDTRAYSLKKIYYPTKGYTEFEYESNEYYSQIDREVFSESFTLDANEFTGSTGSKTSIQDPEGTISALEISISNSCSNSEDPYGFYPLSSCTVVLKDKNGQVLGDNPFTSTGTRSLHYANGDYSELTLEMEQNGDCGCTATVSWRRTVTEVTPTNVTAPGLRIGKITSYPIQGLPVEKTYLYNKPGTSISSGVYYDHPLFYSTIKTPGNSTEYDEVIIPNTDSSCEFLVRQNAPFYALGSNSGQAVAYNHVQEVITGSGYTQYEYLNKSDWFPERTIPITPVTSYGWARGLLRKKTVFDEAGNKVLEVENDYIYDRRFVENSSAYQGGDKLTYGLTVAFEESNLMGSDGTQIYTAPSLSYNIYALTSSWIKNVETTTRNYYSDGEVEQQVSRQYSNFQNLLPTHILEHGSDNSLRNTYLRYPLEGLNGEIAGYNTAIAQALVDEYRIEEILEKEVVSRNAADEILAETSQRTNFKPFHGKILPENIQSSKSDSGLEDRLEFLDYDTYGNLTQVSQSDGPVISYIWGYNRQYPIAKIENATYADVRSALSITSMELDNYDESDLGAINNLRSSLPQAMITTYTYKAQVGIESITDPKGYTTFYEYDHMNRLEFVKETDANGDILSENKYHFKSSSN